MMTMRILRLGSLAFAAALCGGCGASRQDSSAGQAIEVGVVVVQPRSTTVTTQLPGRTVAFRSRRCVRRSAASSSGGCYTEGALVEAGQCSTNWIRRPSRPPTTARRRSRQRRGERADDAAQVRAYLKLCKSPAMSASRIATTSPQTCTRPRREQTVARAALETARINLGYTRIVAPIAGRIATSVVYRRRARHRQPGGAADDGAAVRRRCTSISRSRRPKCCACAAQVAAGALASTPASHGADVALLLEDGTPYPQRGTARVHRRHRERKHRCDHVARRVPESRRGAAARHVRARGSDAGVATVALLVPQQAVSRDARGDATCAGRRGRQQGRAAQRAARGERSETSGA